MENRRNVNAIGTQDSIIMKSLEKKERLRSRNDIMTRRLKNRERQRRYRARKRLEADMKKSSVTNHSTTPQGDLEINENHNNYITRVHCKRNWKKDARRAHACKNLPEVPSAAVVSGLTLSTESQTQSALEAAIEPPLERKSHSENLLSLQSSETKTNLGRRDWKAEARRKKN
ncbi:hypothetical protein P3X46_032272 [Hevea brasiliensis]|uniref:BZIP domain-containing protein n=1 Tax=Hevea brasiliensis TaxID=3981 RepID=A0ABQ9KEQ4_HEVBR|nr:uncharacterized protein LOC110661430 [Hevea brasiliensis]KAJ9135051.1 hypothetical protein P3X46_032272 [Hevea brasiliensis]